MFPIHTYEPLDRWHLLGIIYSGISIYDLELWIPDVIYFTFPISFSFVTKYLRFCDIGFPSYMQRGGWLSNCFNTLHFFLVFLTHSLTIQFTEVVSTAFRSSLVRNLIVFNDEICWFLFEYIARCRKIILPHLTLCSLPDIWWNSFFLI